MDLIEDQAMLYFGGAGVQTKLHPSLRAYIECFHNPPFPKQFPRGGGIWDQDPLLMLHFRAIQRIELECKQNDERIEQSKRQLHGGSIEPTGGGGIGLEDALTGYLDTLGEDGQF